METFHGKAHLPGADKEWNIEMGVDWGKKEVKVHIDKEIMLLSVILHFV